MSPHFEYQIRESIRAKYESPEIGVHIIGFAKAVDDIRAGAIGVLAFFLAAFLILNKYPYSSGHLMVVPYRRTSRMEDLTDEETLDLWHLAIHAQRLLRDVVKAEGFNVGFNLGSTAGAGFEEHLHLHVVPRWTGDQNFMPMIAGTRIIPEGLMPLYEKLVAADQAIEGSQKTRAETQRRGENLENS